MNEETRGKATSSEDVRRQIQGQPTVAQQGTGVVAGVSRIDELTEALHRARALDAQGKDPECMDVVRHAKELAKAN